RNGDSILSVDHLHPHILIYSIFHPRYIPEVNYATPGGIFHDDILDVFYRFKFCVNSNIELLFPELYVSGGNYLVFIAQGSRNVINPDLVSVHPLRVQVDQNLPHRSSLQIYSPHSVEPVERRHHLIVEYVSKGRKTFLCRSRKNDHRKTTGIKTIDHGFIN